MHFYTGKVYFEIRDKNHKHPQEEKFVVYGNASEETVWQRYLAAASDHISGAPKYIFYTINYEKTIKELINKFQVRVAGGGVVYDILDRMLIIKRNGVYDIPKGHLEKGETIEECAVREVEEETGISSKIISPIVESFHTYLYKGKHVLKHTYWFKMRAISEDQLTKPQVEEGIEEILWLDKHQVKDIVWKNTYKSIKDVFNKCEIS
ncbi:NUDIX hydrolase [Flammeovirga pacifica]|uniref:Nudix hydrolase domain-containing protein n=1 Tax=Flammeovirga pacifica TaxID=915059 RepID=A0A1S1Z382_FLAPC|nr:NUDIX domain-containing protein [Flammeovirga pacifica]OHX67535.1 hypothetical protein NH26_14850 [Flammeovirga pacifica]